MFDPTTTLGFALVPLLVIALLVGGFMAGRQSMLPRVREAASMFEPVTIAPARELVLARETIKAQTGVIDIITTTQVVPPSPFTTLPATARIPSRIEVATSSVLAVEVMQLRERVTVLEREADYYYHLKTKHWISLKRLRQKVAAMVPTEVAELKADGFTRSLAVAKSAFGRAADLSTAITELDVARAESQSLEEFNTEFEQILERHQIGVTA